MIPNIDVKIAYYFHIHGKEVVHGIETPVILFLQYPALIEDLLNKPTLRCGDMKTKFAISHNGFYVAILSDKQDKEATAMIDELVAIPIAPEMVLQQTWRERIDTLVNTLQASDNDNWGNLKKIHSFHCENDVSSY